MTGGKLLKCSFCGKTQHQVQKLVAGPGVYICNECIDLCNEIIVEESKPRVGTMPLSEAEGSSGSVPAAEPHLVGVAEIADIVGVSRQRIAQLIASYDDFPRPEAELASGRVWARAAVETWVAAHPERRPGRSPDVQVNFSAVMEKDAVAAMSAAAEWARTMGRSATSTEHVLLGLFEPDDSLAARVLTQDVGVSAERARAAVEAVSPPSEPVGLEAPPADASVKALLENAALAAFVSGRREIGTDHLLRALVRDQAAPGAKVLLGFGVSKGFVVDRAMAARRAADTAAPRGSDDDQRQSSLDKLAAAVRALADDVAKLRDEVRSSSG